jgi:hypothetical protein
MIKEILLSGISRSLVDHVAEAAAHEPEVFDELYALIFCDEPKVAWRATWVAEKLFEKHPELLQDKIPELIALLPHTLHDGSRRSLLIIIGRSKAYQHFNVDFINRCFEWMLSPSQAFAVQVHCMRILTDYCQVMPEFTGELIATLENTEPADYSKAFAAAKRKALKQLLIGTRH